MKNSKTRKSVKKIKLTVEKYKGKIEGDIKVLKKKMFQAVKNYKEAMEAERMAIAKKKK